MLTQAQIDEYNAVGAIVVPDILSPAEVQALRQTTDEFVEKSRALTTHDAVYDLEDTHSPAQPRVRRIKAPHAHHPVFARLPHHPRIIAALQSLWGPNLGTTGGIRFDSDKLNLKSAGYGAAVEWHQDWAFYPHTNDDLAAVGIMMDDMALENGPLLIVPGSHRGPVHDHHHDGRFCGAMNPETCDVDFAAAIPLTGPAGSITIHHVRAIHGSAVNTSDKDRRLLLFQFRAADAWPLVRPPTDIAEFDKLIVAGQPTLAPRMTACPIRLPLPPADRQGSIYENQKALPNRFFATPPRPATDRLTQRLRPRHIPPYRRHRTRIPPVNIDTPPASLYPEARPSRDEAEAAVRTLLRWAGENPAREGLRGTPDRVVRSYEEFFAGYHTDPVAMLERTFEETEGYDEIVLLRGIRLESYCEHHMVPIVGVAHVAYLPLRRVVGISKLARVVDAYAKRLQIQEKLTAQIANTINDVLKPRGVAVIIEAEHQCMSTRGVHKEGVGMVTSRMLGEFRDNPSTRREVLAMIGR